MRAFIAIGLPRECRRAIVSAVSALGGGDLPVSWVPGGNMHLTLKFLGEIPPGSIDEVARLMGTAARDIPAIEFAVEGAGGFPSLRAPRVLWVGILDSLELVVKLQENMENALAGAGFPREGRPFHPHVTVGRVKGRLAPGWGEKYHSAISGVRFGTVFATSYGLYESRLSPAGATYTVAREVPLGGRPADRREEQKT